MTNPRQIYFVVLTQNQPKGQIDKGAKQMFLLWDVQITLQSVVQLVCLFDHFKLHFKLSKQDKEYE